MPQDIHVVDAFTDRAFSGNPAAVCVLREEPAESWMQAVAAEMNLSETAFIVPHGDNEFSIRWFTPTVEVPLCGHATLASAHLLWEKGIAGSERPITFHSKEGVLTAEREGDWVCLDFPSLPVEARETPPGLSEALGCEPLSVHVSRMGTLLVEVESEETVRRLETDFVRLREIETGACIVTARGTAGRCDFVSRFFAPGLGIDEDPVTGVAHCSLTPFWADRLGKSELLGHQISNRGGVVKVRLRGDRVSLLGQAVTVLAGAILA
jgi:PhzF family phenazine biosynthesis protein